MENGIEIVNRVGEDLSVRMEKAGGTTRVIIELPENRVKLSTLKAGDSFRAGGDGYIVLEQFRYGMAAVIRKEELKDSMEFGPNNNWKEGDIRKRLNGEYLDKLKDTFGDGNITEHAVDLTSLDGLKDYGKSIDKVSILDIDRYRRYREVLKASPDCFWFLATPDSTPSGLGSYDILHVAPDGDVGVDICSARMHARPYFVLNSSVLVTVGG